MKAVILAGGLGTRISEETSIKPKPMVEVGDMPIIWHIMKIYSHYGINDFVILCGYKGYVIKEFFVNYAIHRSSINVDLSDDSVSILGDRNESWKVALIDTGMDTMTGGRIKAAREHIGSDTFLLTYGDGVCDIDIRALVDTHQQSDALVTLTAVQPPGRFGALALTDKQTRVNSFKEKLDGEGAWINGGYFVVDPKAIDYIDGPSTTWENDPLGRLAEESKLEAFKHRGFWQPMDTLRDKQLLQSMWDANNAPWKVW